MSNSVSNDPKRRALLIPIDPKEWGIKEPRLINVSLVNHLQECAEIERLIHDEGFCQGCKTNRHGEAIVALDFEWYRRSLDLLTVLLQRAILGTESFLSGCRTPRADFAATCNLGDARIHYQSLCFERQRHGRQFLQQIARDNRQRI